MGVGKHRIVHPDRGVLVIEVKRGRIRYDGTTGQWWSNQNPIKIATRHKTKSQRRCFQC